MKVKNRDEKIILLIGLTVVAVIISAVFSIMTARGSVIKIGPIVLNSSQIAGVLTSVRAIVFIAMVFASKRYGSKVSYFVIAIGVVPIIIEFSHGSFNGIPGLAQNVSAVLMVALVDHFLSIAEKQKKVLQNMAEQDPLTGMKNRRSINKDIAYLLDEEKNFYLCYFTIENFKIVNDTIGRDYGDKLLIAVANRLQALLREGEFCGRITGPDFLLVIETSVPSKVIEERIKDYVKVLSKPIVIGNVESPMEIKAAIVKSPEDGLDVDVLYRHLDGTLSRSKSTHDKRIFFYNASITSEISEAFHIEDRLFKALDDDLLHLVFQPQFTADTKKLRGFETLSRLEDEDGTPIRPDKFISIAERTNLIFKVDDWVLKAAVEKFSPIIKENPDLIISVNISARHFQRLDYADYVLKVLKDYDFPPKNLEIEITETAFADSISVVQECLRKLRDISVKVALDDFGTGYASLSYLSALPINLLKIDKSFIDKLNVDGSTDNEFVKLIISMGHTLNLEVISEGVELEEQRNLLNDWGCDLIQGYLWGRPVDFDQACAIIENQK